MGSKQDRRVKVRLLYERNGSSYVVDAETDNISPDGVFIRTRRRRCRRDFVSPRLEEELREPQDVRLIVYGEDLLRQRYVLPLGQRGPDQVVNSNIRTSEAPAGS